MITSEKVIGRDAAGAAVEYATVPGVQAMFDGVVKTDNSAGIRNKLIIWSGDAKTLEFPEDPKKIYLVQFGLQAGLPQALSSGYCIYTIGTNSRPYDTTGPNRMMVPFFQWYDMNMVLSRQSPYVVVISRNYSSASKMAKLTIDMGYPLSTSNYMSVGDLHFYALYQID